MERHPMAMDGKVLYIIQMAILHIVFYKFNANSIKIFRYLRNSINLFKNYLENRSPQTTTTLKMKNQQGQLPLPDFKTNFLKCWPWLLSWVYFHRRKRPREGSIFQEQSPTLNSLYDARGRHAIKLTAVNPSYPEGTLLCSWRNRQIFQKRICLPCPQSFCQLYDPLFFAILADSILCVQEACCVEKDMATTLYSGISLIVTYIPSPRSISLILVKQIAM